ncbi:hypothetical protein M378DRAFT_159100 [Amanita muscaria Koide BX008]|uniref:Uncharacterized protein n=1 Tax=Amanita muscaria (strain Koide BX008) TaxID=946122 RepID=A0A0C2SWP0_AMAMK|nr:hypothetical protein M378DRAFT_159100 [Amanita muscaria Koide BX008]
MALQFPPRGFMNSKQAMVWPYRSSVRALKQLIESVIKFGTSSREYVLLHDEAT